MKRIVSISLAMILLLTAVAGWAEEEKKDSWLCDEKTVLSVFCFDRVTTTAEAPDNDLPYWKWIEDYTNVHIDWQLSPVSNYTEIVSAKLAAGEDMADITIANTKLAKNAGMNGLVINLADYWDTCFTNAQAYYEKMGIDFYNTIKNEDGTVYGIPGSVNPTEGHCLFDYNTEWLKSLDAEVPSTLDEFTDLCYKMKEAGDLNGNGVDDEIILTAPNVNFVLYGMYPAFGIPHYDGKALVEVDDQGVVSELYTSERLKDCFTYLHQLYADGILNAETITGANIQQEIASDKVGIFYYYAHFAWIYGAATTAGQADPMGEYFTMGPGLASSYNGGKNVIIRRDVFSDGNCAMISSDSKYPELAMKWIDTVIHDENCLATLLYGIPEEHWYYDENGRPVQIPDESGNVVNVYALGGGQTPIPQLQPQVKFDVIYAPYEWGYNEYWTIRDNAEWWDEGVIYPGNYTDTEQEILDMVQTDINTYFSEMSEKFITGDADIEAEWDTYKDTLNALGLESFVQVWQSIYDRTR